MAKSFGNVKIPDEDDDDDDSDDVDYVPSEHGSFASEASGLEGESGDESDGESGAVNKRKRKSADADDGNESPSRKKLPATSEDSEKRAAQIWEQFKSAVGQQTTKTQPPEPEKPVSPQHERKLPILSEIVVQTKLPSQNQPSSSQSTPKPVVVNSTSGVAQLKPSPNAAKQPPPKIGASSSRLGSILSQIGQQKKSKNMLEQSREHWEEFKQAEGISEDLALHNRGSKGYLDRQDFLARVDSRQADQLREMRLQLMNKRRTT